MCGICGVFEFNDPTPVAAETVLRMAKQIAHRGPDDEGAYVAPHIGLGHRRLSIIDVAGGHQPLSNEDGTVWVLLNGEIYNYQELRSDLISRGHKFKTVSDTEAIAHCYEEYGSGCFERLHGMFAIAIWDARNKRLTLARDRVGKKPLFYATNGDRIVFGSELKTLLAYPGISREIDEQALSDYFSLGYIPAPKTIYRSVRKVLPAHFLEITASDKKQRAYWNIDFRATEERPESEWTELLRSQLESATKKRLMSEVPLGAFLSGGLDSSAVVSMMAKTSPGPVVTCSIGFNDEKFDESAYAQEVAGHFKTQHHSHRVEPDALHVIDKLAWHFDEPFADSSAVPTYYVSKVAREHVTVALGGDGGDENFAGYRRYLFDLRENQVRAIIPRAFRAAVFAPLGRAYPAMAWAPQVFRAKATFQSLSREPIEGYFNTMSIFRPGEKEQLLSEDLQARLAGYDSLSVLREHYDAAPTDDPLTRIQYVDMKTYLPDDILTKVDRASMAVSLEVRAPILDHQLMEMAARMPSSLKLKGNERKHILKKSMEGILPDDIIYRPKQGFSVPLARWFRADIKDMAHAALFDKDDPVLQKSFVRRVWDQHQSGSWDRSPYLWALLMYKKWAAEFGKA